MGAAEVKTEGFLEEKVALWRSMLFAKKGWVVVMEQAMGDQGRGA